MNRLIYAPKFFVLLYLTLCLGAKSICAETELPQEIAKKSFQSVVLLVMEDDSGQPVSLGSGFFVRDGEIASNLHVIEGASRGYAKIVGQKTKYDIEGITGIDPNYDLVLLKISATSTLSLQLGNSDVVEVGEPVYAVGNPQGLEGTFSQGIVSGIRSIGSDKILQITAPISPGSSGGPVLNSKCEVIGVSVATFRGGQNLNFAIPSNYLQTLLAKAYPAKPFTSTKSPGKQQSIFADLGGRSTEGVVGTNLTYDSYAEMGDYSFSLINKLRDPVQNVYCLVVFYDVKGAPLDVAVVRYPGVIPGGLAKRVTGKVDISVERLNAEHNTLPPHPPKGKIEFRVLDFQIID